MKKAIEKTGMQERTTAKETIKRDEQERVKTTEYATTLRIKREKVDEKLETAS